MKIYIETYGCALNRADTGVMKEILKEHGYWITSSEEQADIIVLNTCGVKETTEKKILYKIDKLAKEMKSIVITGCLATDTNRIRKLTRAPIVFPNAVDRIKDAVESSYLGIPDKEYKAGWVKPNYDLYASPNEENVAYIPISEGCTGACTYCFSKFARPKLKSFPEKWVVRQVERAIKNGALEIDITSMDSGAYGMDIGSNLVDLLNHVLDVNGRYMVRLGMINPAHAKRLGKRLIDVYKREHIFKFLHAPVQTGSEKICKDMNRPHTVSDFIETVERFRREIPDITISTDIIVGYPTETEDDFNQTIQLIKKIKPDVVNISRFSTRPYTKAGMLKQMSTEEKKRRSQVLTDVVHKIEEEKNRVYLGKILDVFVMYKQEKNGRVQYIGKTRNYKKVAITGEEKDVGTGSWEKVKIEKTTRTTLFGKLMKLV